MKIKNVGVSLLAKAVGQSIKVLNVNPPSRAGSLPQGIVGDTEFASHEDQKSGSEPARESVLSVNIYIN
ncbi:hypothetical protein [Pseudomonas sp. SW-3]|uniref:hypothetical protein n=1 Tax=Pseudomonas sp. SW-3 TaxID=147212 RepID=UPI001F26BC9F|nr:hypothetical protein [Pseudomonas sp. SW-3]